MGSNLKTLLSIALIAAANVGSVHIVHGQSATTISADVLTRYTVAEGDNLSRIAEQNAVYGDGYLWPLIFKANTDKLSDPEKLKPGMVLVIPRNLSQPEIDAASSYAKKRPGVPSDRVKELDLEYLQGD
jgi:LysM repeat protein